MKKHLLFLLAALLTFNVFAQTEADETQQADWTLTVTRQCKQTEDVVTTYDLEKLTTVKDGSNVHYIVVNLEPVTETTETSKFLLNLKSNVANKTLGLTTYFSQPNEKPVYVVACWLKGSNIMAVHSGGNYKVCGTSVETYAAFKPTYDGETYTTYFNLFDNPTIKSGQNVNKYYSGVQFATNSSFVVSNNRPGQDPNQGPGIYSATLNFKDIAINIQKATSMNIFVDKYATFTAPVTVEIPAGIKAYASMGVNVNLPSATLVLEELTEGIIPAYTPVYLKTEDGSSATYSFNISPEGEYIVEESYIGQASNGNKSNYFKDTNILVEGDTREGAFAGVNMLHAINTNESGVTNYDNEYDYYVLEKGKFVRVQEKDDKDKAINLNYVLDPFTCYVQLPNNDNNPDEIEIYIPKEDVLYLHFTDNEGNYLVSHDEAMAKDVNGAYSLTLKVPAKTNGNTEYFVLSDATLPINYVASRAVDNTWADLGTVYHAGEQNGTLSKYELGENNPTPIAVATGSTYSIKANVADPENSSIEIVKQGGGTTTGIENVSCNANTADDRMYNIYGMPVDASYKGLVIKNGKKIIVR